MQNFFTIPERKLTHSQRSLAKIVGSLFPFNSTMISLLYLLAVYCECSSFAESTWPWELHTNGQKPVTAFDRFSTFPSKS